MTAKPGAAIPTKRREQVKEREHYRCARCPGLGQQWHHRRGRAVRGDHRHCSCNGVWLCHSCHSWVHANPIQATEAGYIVSRTVEVPGEVPISLYRGTLFLTCDGLYREPSLPPPQET